VQVKQQHPNLIMVDYTVPDVIHDMVDLYIKHKTPFVMGTTGGNRAQILADVTAADLYAVIAPQMGKQVSSIDSATDKMADSCAATRSFRCVSLPCGSSTASRLHQADVYMLLVKPTASSRRLHASGQVQQQQHGLQQR
jgi:hypothetical protein